MTLLFNAPRLVNWPELLSDYFLARARAPFAWGFQDCCCFAASGVEAMTGADPIADLRGYRTEEEAGRILNRPLDVMVSERLAQVGPGLALRGDVGLIIGARGNPALCLVDGDMIVGAGLRGLERHPRSALKAAWRV